MNLIGHRGFDWKPLLFDLGNNILPCPSLPVSLVRILSSGHSKEIHVL